MDQDNKNTKYRLFRRIGLSFVFLWFVIGGISHFAFTDLFLKIIPPGLPFRLQAVYISGFFELLGAFGLLLAATRKMAGIGLFALTVAVTPANVYMWLHHELFARIPTDLLVLRLPLQLVLLAIIWWSAIHTPNRRAQYQHHLGENA